MNKVFLMGRLTRDPDLRTTSNQISVATFSLAVDRRYKSADGERQADFINVVAWRHTAEFIGKYCKKGSKIVVFGNIQTRTYDDKDGKRVYVTEVVAEEVEFAESRRDSYDSGQQRDYNAPSAPSAFGTGANRTGSNMSSNDDGFSINDDDDTKLPFDI